MLLLNCEVTLDLNCVICEEDRPTTFAMINAKLYVPVVTLWTQDNAKLLQQLKLGSKEQLTGININQKHHQKPKIYI